jgi:hypothetical protein
MFEIEKDNTIHVNRGDVLYFGVLGQDADTKEPLIFQPGDIVRIKVYGKNKASNVVLEKDFAVESPIDEVFIYLDGEDTNIGGIINEPKEYSYEVVRNPGVNKQTLIGHFDEGAVSFFLYPEGADIPKKETEPEDVPVVDKELDMLSERPIANRAVAAAVTALMDEIRILKNKVNSLEGGN